MFTGIVETVGRLKEVRRERGGAVLHVEVSFPSGPLALGESIATAGVCLTVEEVTSSGFFAFASPETVARTTLGTIRPGERVNLERALRADSRLGGHFVTGHVDGVGRVRRVVPAGASIALTIEAPREVKRLLAPKGAIAVDGVSLTVNSVSGLDFTVTLVPHTLKTTTLQTLKPGHRVNIEADILARYVAAFLGTGPSDFGLEEGG